MLSLDENGTFAEFSQEGKLTKCQERKQEFELIIGDILRRRFPNFGIFLLKVFRLFQDFIS